MKHASFWALPVLSGAMGLGALGAPALAQDESEEPITDYTVGFAHSVIESTYDVFPQIQMPPDTPHPKIVPIQKLPIGGPKDPDDFKPTPRKYGGWEGISQTPWSPPDPTIGVGPNHVIETVNMHLSFWDKSGNLKFSQRLDGSSGFFGSVGAGGFTFDPKCCYHDGIDRYFVLALEVYGSSEAWITFAISDDNDPNGTWYKYRTDAVFTVGSNTYWWDYPGLGYDEDAFYVTGNLFGLSGGGFAGVGFRAIDISSILSGGTASYADLRHGSGASAQCTVQHGSARGGYMVSTNSSTTLRVYCITNPTSSPSLHQTTVSVSSYSSPPNAPDQGGGSIDTLDGRMINSELRGSRMVCGHGVDGSGGNAVSRWYEIDLGNWPSSGGISRAQEGEIDLGSNIYTWYPALAINTDGDIGLISARSSNSEFAGVIYTRQEFGAASGSMESPRFSRTGEATASGRWGDYFDACVDAADDTTFWGVGEYQHSGGWGTYINCFQFGLPSDGFLFSVKTTATFGGIKVDDADLLVYDNDTGSMWRYFDFSDTTSGNADIDAACLLPDGTILVSFVATEDIDGLTGGPNGTQVLDEDIIRFVPTSLGDSTSGSWEFYFDGSDVGLGGSDKFDIDALGYNPVDDVLHMSLRGRFTIGALSGKDEDVLEFTATSLGSTTAGSFAMLLDGSDDDVKLAKGPEDIDAYSYHESLVLSLSTTGDFRVPKNLFGQDNDVLHFAATVLGTDPDGTFSVVFDGASVESTMDIDCLHYFIE